MILRFTTSALFATLLTFTCNAQYKLGWATSNGTTSPAEGFAIAQDTLGNVYTTGYYTGTVDFDPGAGTFNLTAQGARDVYVQKLSPNGSLVWAVSAGGNSNDEANGITIDKYGDLYVTGKFNGNNVDFDPGPLTYMLHAGTSNDDMFVLKLDASGNFHWATRTGGSGADDGRAVTVDTAGNIYVTGGYMGTVDFDPGAGTFNITGNSSGSPDIFIQKLNRFGGFIWAKSIGSTSGDHGASIQANELDHIYVGGEFSGTADFDPNAGTHNLTPNGSTDGFILKLTTAGNLVWVKSFAASIADIALDDNGDIYSTGWFFGTDDFDPGAGTSNRTSAGAFDVFVHKLDASGSFSWAQTFGGWSFDYGSGIACDTSGNVYSTGRFTAIVDFDPGVGTYNLTASFADAYIQKLDASTGNFVWATGFGGASSDDGWALLPDDQGSLYATGSFVGTADADPTSAVFNLSSGTVPNAYVIKLSPCNPSSSTDTITACDTYTWTNGITYTTSTTTATDTFINVTGCDSIVTLHLTINNAATHNDTLMACDSLKWIDGITYFADNSTATHTYIGGSANGCDSIVSLILTINKSTTGTDVVTACDSLVWIDGITYFANNNTATHNIVGGSSKGCDSLVTLNLTIVQSATGIDSITSCDSLVWIDGNTYYTSASNATYNIVGGAANGCDSLVTLHLTIHNSATGTDIVAACDSFLWIDGNTYYQSDSTSTHTIVGGAANGCDSIVTLGLTITTIDVSVVTVDPIITAIMSNAAYQWLDCDNNNAAILGYITQNFIATVNGNYAVEISQNGCVDTSECVMITDVGVDSYDPFEHVKLYPNPANDFIFLDLGDHHKMQVTIYNVTGQFVAKEAVTGPVARLELMGRAGLYLLELQAEDGLTQRYQVVKH